MIPAKANLLENQLRQKVVQFEQSLARISDTRKHLRDNADLVKSEIRATFGSQLTQMRRREQQLMETLDTVASVKDGILSEQQDQLHQALGACLQGLEWYETAIEDMKENRLSSMDTVKHHINDVLKKLSVVDINPRETAALSFEADALAIRKAISSFGHVRTNKTMTTTTKSYESLPAHLEDYGDEDMVHSLLHKAVNSQNKNATTVFVGRPLLSNDPKDWLLREALTGHHSAPLTPDDEAEVNQSPLYMKHCVTTTGLNTTDGAAGTENNHLRQAQVHSWLHHIKCEVENEPNVFEDFEIVKDQEVKPAGTVDSIKAELSEEIAAMFRSYFETVLLSPSNQWLLKSMEINYTATTGTASDQLARDYVFDGDMEDLDDCHSTVTYESSGIYFEPRSNDTSLTQDAYSKLWHEFVDALWSSTDSMWLLPCCSDEKPRPLAAGIVAEPVGHASNLSNDHWLSPASHEQRHKIVSEITDRSLSSRMENVALSEYRKPDFDQWLLQSTDQRRQGWPDGGVQSVYDSAADQMSMEQWLGWKALLEKQSNMGDHSWLYHPPASMERDSAKGETSAMDH